jgi:branched-chain amino acid transport system ATP-binding protein
MQTDGALLEVERINVFYGNVHVLHDLSLRVAAGEMVAIIGPNGSGKTTLLHTIQGLLRPTAGEIWLRGRRIDHLPAYDRVARGIALIPETRHLFPDMSVQDHLELGAYPGRARQEMRVLMDMVYALFPALWEKRDRPASSLSAGQQQMLVIGRALMSRPRLLLLDDPFVGLSRGVMNRFCETLARINHGGLTVLIAGQHVRRLLRLADRAYLVEQGRVVLEGKGHELLEDAYLQEVLLGRSGSRDSSTASPRA